MTSLTAVAATSNQRSDVYILTVDAIGVMDGLRFVKFTVAHAWQTVCVTQAWLTTFTTSSSARLFTKVDVLLISSD